MIPSPYLLYLGRATDEISIKTSRGLAVFRREDCIGEFRHDACPLTLSLPRLTLGEAVQAGAKTLVLGIANAGGTLDAALVEDAEAALDAGMNVASGLHQLLRSVPRLVAAAERNGKHLFDVREPQSDIPVGTGTPRAGHRVLTVGTDCSVGKMYASIALTRGFRDVGQTASFRATGQTGILIAGEGVPLDAVVADFISGAIEQICPARADGGWDIVEGQGSLFHPSFAGVSTGLLHGAQPEFIVMCHDPAREHMRGLPGYALPDLAECVEANLAVARLTSPTVQLAGFAMNTSKLARADAERLCAEVSGRFGLPCVDPFAMSVAPLVEGMLHASATARST